MDITSKILGNPKFKELIELNNQYDQAHDLAHFLRVKHYALEIGKSENADLEILEAAALLHDIARGLETTKQIDDHLMTGAEIAKEILEQINFPKDKIEAVSYCVSVHQRRERVEPKILESKIIQDADLVDTYGLVYVARSILWGAQSEKYKRPLFIDENFDDLKFEDRNLSTIHYLKYRLVDQKYDPETLHTKKAKELAHRFNKLTEKFINDFVSEWRGI